GRRGRGGHRLGADVRERAARRIGAHGRLRGPPVTVRQPGRRGEAARPRGRPTGDDHGAVTAPLVEVDDLTFRYRRATEPAIRGISLTIEPGQGPPGAGPYGCGTRTPLRAITGQ